MSGPWAVFATPGTEGSGVSPLTSHYLGGATWAWATTLR